MKNIDRISEAYNGEFGTDFGEMTRERIHWVCSQAKGESVLDVGCSQGIAPTILAREGKKVIGLDICQESIDFANKLLESEDESTRNNVQFVCADFLSFANDCIQKFDSIIMSEVLEHIADPDRFVKRAFELLSESGRIIITVPFGINDYPDHKRTYYFAELFKTVGSYFVIDDDIYFSNSKGFGSAYIGLIATKLSGKNCNSINEKLFLKTEKMFLAHERSLIDAYSQLQNQAHANANSAKSWQEKAEKHLKTIGELKQDNLEQDKNLELLKSKAEILQKENESNIRAVKALSAERDSLGSEKKHLLLEIDNLSKERASLIFERDSIYNSNNAVQEQLRFELWQKDLQYHTLAGSKLGKIQRGIWRLRNKKKQSEVTESVTQIQIVDECEPTTVSEHPDAPASFDLNFLDRIWQRIESIPSSSSGRYYEASPIKLAIISDDFLYHTYKDVANTVPLHPDSWLEQLEGCDAFLIISAWKGLKREWAGISCVGSVNRNIALDVIKHCRDNEIPTIFYSIEDPPNYEHFLELANACEFIFTTAAEMVESYKHDCNNENVFSLMFGINPNFHNPVGSKNSHKFPDVIFSGSWYEKYKKRGDDTRAIFDGVLSSSRNLKIIDRNLELKLPQYVFPEKYNAFISPAIPHEKLQKVHKLYDWAININTVTESSTMFANRAYELEATGNLLLSNYSVGINSHLPIIYTVQDSNEVTRILDNLHADEISDRQSAGIRHAMTGNTCFDRFTEICNVVGFSVNFNNRSVAVVVADITEALRKQFDLQTYKSKELILENELALRYHEFDMITFFHNDMEYDMFYLEDMINGFKYTKCDYITKDSYFRGDTLAKGAQHDFVKGFHSKYCTVFWGAEFCAQTLLDFPVDHVALENGYSIDNLNFNMSPVEKVRMPRHYKLSVILPIYNNGLHLYGKSFASLLRSSIFEDMEIILVDDGSTDGFTENMIRYIEKRYDNVKSFFFGDGGSGSASRPRNKGVEMSTAQHIIFLDPDNEAIEDGYAKLYDLAVGEAFDLVVGDMICFREKQYSANYYSYFVNLYKSDIVEGDKREFVKSINFTPMSIQAMVIDKRLLENSKIEQVVGAVGEDSLFSLQLFVNASRIKALNCPIHIYYAQVAGSTVNTIGKSFFEKSLLSEHATIKWLEGEELLTDYMNLRFNNYFRDWYIQKLSFCKAEDTHDCRAILLKIFEPYEDHYNKDDEMINNFLNNQLLPDSFKEQESPKPFDLNFADRIDSKLLKIPDSSSGRFFKAAESKLCIIADEFLYKVYKDVANTVAIHPNDWETQIEGCDLLLFSVTWRGLCGEWKSLEKADSKLRKTALEIIEFCKGASIPVVFYAKEDPPDYQVFLELALACDYIFTSAAEMIPKYLNECGHSNVYSLMFGINPLFHNPVGSQSVRKLSDVIFSGSWYEKFPERRIDMRTIFDGVLASNRGLNIINRNFFWDDSLYFFPEKYNPYIAPAIEHNKLQKVHKLYDWAINISTVKESHTMFANRAYELGAIGNLQISNYSVGINTHLPNIFTIHDSDEVANIIDTLPVNETRERQASGIRHAMTENTCYDRYAKICEKVGLSVPPQKRIVAVVVKEITENLINQFNSQTYADKVLLREGDLLHRYSEFDMVAFFHDEMEYEMFYLEDMINGFKYTDCDYITKNSYYFGSRLIKGCQHNFVDSLHSKYCTVFWCEAFGVENLKNMNDGQNEIPNGYSIDCLHFNMAPIVKPRLTKQYKMTIIIPVFNDGLRLYCKAFASLLRSSMFADIEIILVDGGSTDGITTNYLRYMEKRYDNVKAYLSGGGTNACTKGVELATTNHLIFMSSGSEAIHDAYAKMYEAAISSEYDLVVGNAIRAGTRLIRHNIYNSFVTTCNAEEICDTNGVLENLSAVPLEIQATIINKRLLTNKYIFESKLSIDSTNTFLKSILPYATTVKAIPVTPVLIYEKLSEQKPE